MRYVIKLALITCLLIVACGRDQVTPTPTQIPVGQTIIQSEEAAQSDQSGSAPPLSSTPYASAMPLPTPRGPLVETYVVRWGDTLSGISMAFDVSIDELVALNGLDSEAAIIQIGQTLQVPLDVSRSGPNVILLPDSEVVFSPAYLDFDVKAFVAQQGGYLNQFSSPVNGVWISGAEAVQRVARQYSVGPRVLLTILEHYGGWVTQSQPFSYQPLGAANPYYEESFFLQLSWAANYVNEGYYDYKRNGHVAVRFRGGGRALMPAGLNAGTVGIQNFLALNSDWETWQVERQAFMETYQRLFGDPFAWAVEPLVPIDLAQPVLRLPWEPGISFFYTGGPHAAFGSRSAWAAVDFAPPDIKGSCYYSSQNLTAVADGRLLLGETGEMYLDLDADGNLQTGWVLLYLHAAARDDVSHGQLVVAGTPLGYASCEGGISTSSHLHLARRYNGEWMMAEGPVPLVLSGWQVQAGIGQYEGTMVRDGVTKTACEDCSEAANALLGE